MRIPEKYQQEIYPFPEAPRTHVDAPLKAGNANVAVGRGFPASPAGAYVQLEQSVSTRPLKTADGVNFYDRNPATCSGEFTDAQRCYFVLEPARPLEAHPDF
ncbi:MAG: hypothetical protein JNK23_22195 [Opitutaceae bacterium]|nr:hypothetical protein [Opitutaceae bacterium]